MFVSVDGTDFRIEEPRPFSPDWYSHKFHGAGLRYEVCVSISTGFISWANGPFPCGLFPDIKIFNYSLSQKLDFGEQVLADGGYSGPKCIDHMTGRKIGYSQKIRARHETVNRRFKQFSVLSSRFRHKPALHSFCFYAILNLTQISLETTNPLFHID